MIIRQLRAHLTESGVALAEVLVALLIMAIVGGAALAGTYTTVKSNDSARAVISAESLARSELEYVLSQPYDTNWTSYTLPGGSVPTGWDAHSLPSGYSGYSVTVTCSYPYISTAIQKISVEVKNNGSPVLAIATYMAQ